MATRLCGRLRNGGQILIGSLPRASEVTEPDLRLGEKNPGLGRGRSWIFRDRLQELHCFCKFAILDESLRQPG